MKYLPCASIPKERNPSESQPDGELATDRNWLSFLEERKPGGCEVSKSWPPNVQLSVSVSNMFLHLQTREADLMMQQWRLIKVIMLDNS